jgi:carbonic anhydrase
VSGISLTGFFQKSYKSKGMVKMLRLISSLPLHVIAATLLAASFSFAQEGVPSDVALSRLRSGNERFSSGKLQVKDYNYERRELTKGQHPYAVVLACSDSRVAPEIVFDESLGKLFIVRVAGNVADPVVLGSIEYAIEHLGANLLLVLGHENCGAVKATMAGGHLPPNIAALVNRISPAVDKLRSQKLDAKTMLDTAIKENVRYQMQMALFESEILSHSVKQRKLKVAGGVYNLNTGKVDVVSSSVAFDHHEEEQHHAAAPVHHHESNHSNIHATTSHPVAAPAATQKVVEAPSKKKVSHKTESHTKSPAGSHSKPSARSHH